MYNPIEHKPSKEAMILQVNVKSTKGVIWPTAGILVSPVVRLEQFPDIFLGTNKNSEKLYERTGKVPNFSEEKDRLTLANRTVTLTDDTDQFSFCHECLVANLVSLGSGVVVIVRLDQKNLPRLYDVMYTIENRPVYSLDDIKLLMDVLCL